MSLNLLYPLHTCNAGTYVSADACPVCRGSTLCVKCGQPTEIPAPAYKVCFLCAAIP